MVRVKRKLRYAKDSENRLGEKWIECVIVIAMN